MIIRVDSRKDRPLYLQIRSQIVGAIARKELVPGQALPSVRSLAGDLGINLHTVNKAYAVLRDEGYVLMQGRTGTHIADPCDEDRDSSAQEELHKMEDQLFEMALAYRARGSTRGQFMECAHVQAARAYGVVKRKGNENSEGASFRTQNKHKLLVEIPCDSFSNQKG